MSTTQRTYETTIIVNASLEDSQIDAVIGRVQDAITKNGGAIAAVNKWGRKRLAYPIRKKTNGFYVNIEFTGPGTLLGTLERGYQLDEMILRYLNVQLDKKAIAARAARPASTPTPEAPTVSPSPEPSPEGQSSPDEEKK